MAGLGRRTAVVWLDAHGDLNTPETTASAFFDGTALATLLGDAWPVAVRGVPGFAPRPPERVLVVGARDLDPQERRRLEEGRPAWVRCETLHQEEGAAALAAAIDRAAGDALFAYLHVDLDVLDPVRVGGANGYAAAGGLEVDQVLEVAALTARRLPVGALALTAYDPSCDPQGRVAAAALRIAGAVVGEVVSKGRERSG